MRSKKYYCPRHKEDLDEVIEIEIVPDMRELKWNDIDYVFHTLCHPDQFCESFTCCPKCLFNADIGGDFVSAEVCQREA